MVELKNRIKYQFILPQNSEQYRAIRVDHFQFLDSYQFMSASLDNLMKNLTKTVSPEKMEVINSCRASLTEETLDTTKRNLQLSKGIVPWSLVTDHDFLKIPREKLPVKEEYYYSILTESTPSKEEIQRAAEYYQKYECKNLLEYIMQYCETDVVQLAQIFHKFRMKIFKFAKIDVLKFVGECSKIKLIRTYNT